MEIFKKIVKIIIKVIFTTFIIASIISFILLVMYCSVINEKKHKQETYEQGYVDACKDFYQGKLKYDLISNPDGTREWKKIKK